MRAITSEASRFHGQPGSRWHRPLPLYRPDGRAQECAGEWDGEEPYEVRIRDSRNGNESIYELSFEGGTFNVMSTTTRPLRTYYANLRKPDLTFREKEHSGVLAK